jgi:group I intron endonuclease
MLYIYCFINKITGKRYIGQTNNIEKRKRGHKSESFNPKANGYNLPFHCAIRKYGWENFDFVILEEINDNFGREYLNEREIYFISYYQSLINQNGYNYTEGGAGCAKPKLSFSEQVKLSKLFNEDEVRDIQNMLLDGYEYFEVKKKYPMLTDSFLSNINLGLNFVRDDLTYPLATLHTKFTKETKENIIQDIQANIAYKEISKKYGISTGYISMINKGTKWHNDKLNYPLCKKGCSDGAWSKDAKYDLIFTDLTHAEIGKKYNKQKSTITALNTGRNRKDNRLKYPLRQYQNENQQIWITLF